ncbi:hypothetical protein ICM_05888 [Bacillus cereus BAG1X2-3]|uniref:hypothetical protein n=1 Tax=Bacillus cereus TaxID=1396 RepID=UPI00032FFD8E|nr:hypothetical protein [Bacillus cereus]EOO24853.1 hypothetical protein ICC_05046 [Bacillus cereus BAG1X1-1]EOO44321.1 hypothetical protein ICI_05415 [Bacillus cereus BAG1X2-1]EOO46127.1 hypothetical protein ICK_05469 [Bacillus cereus BAG1X2-2]EOO62574.1 hypothetical protein ICM_05888 [Bacillus cereus BAG1X2-3]EOP01620.1 hypothetical protein ICO_05440 [Bacillus cereus BAG2O-1]
MKSNSQIQEELQVEALGIIDELGILGLLNNFGEAKVVGSVAHKLIVKKDIDIHLLTECDLLEITFLVLNFLRNKNSKFEIHYEDFRNQKSSMFIGIKDYPGINYKWYIDIWITGNRKYTGFDQVEYFKNILTRKQRKTILLIKEHYDTLGMLNNGFSSIIYEAVLHEKVTNQIEFEQYLQEKYS